MKLIDQANKTHYRQSYEKSPQIEGVQLLPVRRFTADEGDFCEVIRLNSDGCLEALPNFKLAQINRTRLFPASVKAWHFHTEQDEIWYVPPAFQLHVGLWDLREESTSANTKMHLNLGGGNSHMLFIPRGVAHGSANFSTREIELMYLVSNTFNLENPDEMRLPWDSAGAEFWKPERD